MPIPGNLFTTAMAVMPHKDVDRALQVALSLDVPFWPQLPKVSYYEDMYVQASEHFPGIVLDLEKRTLRFSMEKFIGEYEETMRHSDDPEYFDISDTYSVVYRRFLQLDLSGRVAIRGQLEGPISFGMNVLDPDGRPILFDDSIRPLLLEVMAKRANVQLIRLKKKNANAFMYIDEPGLQFLFSAMSGFSDQAAKGDLETFFSLIERPRGFISAATRTGIFYWGWTWTFCLWMYTRMEKSLPLTPARSPNFWVEEESFAGGSCPPISSPSRKKAWIPWNRCSRKSGTSCIRRGLTGNFFCPGACCRRPPAAWSIQMLKRPWRKPSER